MLSWLEEGKKNTNKQTKKKKKQQQKKKTTTKNKKNTHKKNNKTLWSRGWIPFAYPKFFFMSQTFRIYVSLYK